MRAKVIFPGAYHHVMNRGVLGTNIFSDDKSKDYFLGIIREKSRLKRVKILVYCIMDNHYHLIIEDSSGRLTEFMREINGNYGMYYRKRFGGRGYVFHDRYKSILIQGDIYLKMATVYVLLNPLRAGIVRNPYEYTWSSINEYFTGGKSEIIDNIFIEEIFGSRKNFNDFVNEWGYKDLPIKKTRLGDMLGRDEFISMAFKRFDRRKKDGESKRMRKKDYTFEPSEKVIERFERKYGVKIGKIDVNNKEGKNLRNELLISLKERAGLDYKGIIKYKPFRSLKYSSLGQLYRRAKNERKKCHKVKDRDNRGKSMQGMTRIFFGLIYKDLDGCKMIRERIESLGSIDIESDEIPFDFTDYYNDEFGSNLKRKWVSINKEIPENELAALKLKSVEWENELSVDNMRTVNCDPGGISDSRVVLVTTKNYAHRVYLGDGIYAEVTLIYSKERFQPLDWTYPDYRTKTFQKFALKCREKFRTPH